MFYVYFILKQQFSIQINKCWDSKIFLNITGTVVVDTEYLYLYIYIIFWSWSPNLRFSFREKLNTIFGLRECCSTG